MKRAVAERSTAAARAGKEGVEPAVDVGACREGALRFALVGEVGGNPTEVGVAPEALGQCDAVVFEQRDHEQSCPFGRAVRRPRRFQLPR